MTIIIAHKPINRSDTLGVMWNHIICTAAVPYNKKVTIFPCQMCIRDRDRSTTSACSHADFAATRPPYNAPNREFPPRRLAP